MQYPSIPSFSSAQGLSPNKHHDSYVLPKSVLDIEGDQIPNVPLPSTSKQSTPTRHVQSELEAFLHGSDPDDVSYAPASRKLLGSPNSVRCVAGTSSSISVLPPG